MHKLNLVAFYQFGKEMRTLLSANDEGLPGPHNLALKMAWVTKFRIETAEVPCPRTHEVADELHEYLRGILSIPDMGTTGFVHLSPGQAIDIELLLKRFETEFDHESREINILSVPNRCAYSTSLLIESGESLLPEGVRQAVTDYVRNELHEAGKCLAFNVPTAAGFHLARGLESALRSYYDVLSGRAPRPKTPSGNDVAMQGYIDQVRKWADQKVISVLEQFTRLHRNPVNHPDVVLTDEDATALVGIVVSAMTTMVRDIESKGHASLS